VRRSSTAGLTAHRTSAISQEIGNGSNRWFGPKSFGDGPFGCSGGLVVAGGVEGEVAEEFAAVGVDDADVVVLHEEDDALVGVGAADAAVVESAVDAQRGATLTGTP